MEMAEEAFRAGDWEWNYYWRANEYATKYIQAVEGLFIGEIVSDLKAALDGTSSIDYSHIFIHDGDIGPMLGALGINALRWPGMASNIAFEVWYVLLPN
jgi:acid phosphatase